MITRFGGNVTDVDEWGKRRFALRDPENERRIFITSSTSRLEKAVPAEVEQRIRIMDNVLRYLCVKNRKHKRKEVYMNKVVLVGRLTRDPEVRYSQGDNATAVARYTLAVDRRFRKRR